MLNQPMSSPMMQMMFGFLPVAWALALTAAPAFGFARASNWALSAPSEQHEDWQQPPAACGPVWAASAVRFRRNWPEAVRYPSSIPAARTTRGWGLIFV